MNTDNNEEKGWQSEGESLNTGSASTENTGSNQQGQQHDKNEGQMGTIHNNALFAAGMGRAATAAVNPHSSADLEQTGTNPAYEGAIGEGAGGSAGTGYTSGKSGTDTASHQSDTGSSAEDDHTRQQADDAADEQP